MNNIKLLSEMNNIEFLSEILEICQHSMNEGDYIRAANMLRDNHNNVPIVNEPPHEEEILYRIPLKICIHKLNDDEGPHINILGYMQTNIPYSATDNRSGKSIQHFICSDGGERFTIECSYRTNSQTCFKNRCGPLKQFINTFFKKYLAVIVSLDYRISFKDFFEFEHNKQIMINDVLDDDNYNSHDDIYNLYKIHVIECIIESLENRVYI